MATCQMHHDDKDGLHREFDHDEVRDGQDYDDVDNRNEPAKQGQNEEQGRHIQLCSSDPGRQTPFEELV